MSRSEITCVVIRHNNVVQSKLEKALRAGNYHIRYELASNLSELKRLLSGAPMLLFCPAVDGTQEHEEKLVPMLQRLAPDCVLVNVVQRKWKALRTSNNGDIDIASVTVDHEPVLRQQIDALCAYVRLKADFRQCKHLLSVSELRSQWLVDYAREAVAFIAQGKHLHVNVAYVSLFGFSSDNDVLTSDVRNLVDQAEWSVFETLSSEAEKGAAPSNRLLIRLRNRQGQRFRAEIRFIPSVFRGRRCVQLHVHPLLRHSQQVGSDLSEKEVPTNPWEQPATSVSTDSERAGVTPHPTKLQTKQLQHGFQELLNLRASERGALMATAPYLNYSDTVRIDYSQLLDNAHNNASRFRLDMWTLYSTFKYLIANKSSPVSSHVLLSLGKWVFEDVAEAFKLLEVLHKNRNYTARLMLAFDIEHCLANADAAKKLFPLFQKSGVYTVMDNVKNSSPAMMSLLALSGAKTIRSYKGYTRSLRGEKTEVIPDALRELLQQMDSVGVSVIVDGIQDIDTLNLLCETTAAYLQGEILNKFSR